MSHPYFPQAMFMYRRRKGSPVPSSYGNYEGVVAPAVNAQPIAAKTFAAGRGATPNAGINSAYARRTMGSLSPKTDWATPGYVRDERSGVHGLGDMQFVVASPTITVPAVGSGQCFEVVWSKIKDLAQDLVDKVAPAGTPSFLKSAPIKLLSNRLAALDKAVFQRIYNGWTAAGGTTEFRKVLVQEQVWLLSLFPSDVLTALNALGGDAVGLGMDQLADFVAGWVDGKIRGCLAGSAGTATGTETTPEDVQALMYCAANGIPLLDCPLPSRQQASLNQVFGAGAPAVAASPTFQMAYNPSTAQSLTTAGYNTGFVDKLSAGLVTMKGTINPIFAQNCANGGGEAYLDANGAQQCRPKTGAATVVPTATSSNTMLLLGAAAVGAFLLLRKKGK